MPFSQLTAPAFPSLCISIQYLSKVRHRITWSLIILNLLFSLSAFAQVRLCPIPRFLESGLGRQYAAINVTDSTTVLNVGGSKSISSTFVGAVLIAPAIIMHAALCRHSSSDLAKAMPIMSHHATAAYAILGIITRL